MIGIGGIETETETETEFVVTDGIRGEKEGIARPLLAEATRPAVKGLRIDIVDIDHHQMGEGEKEAMKITTIDIAVTGGEEVGMESTTIIADEAMIETMIHRRRHCQQTAVDDMMTMTIFGMIVIGNVVGGRIEGAICTLMMGMTGEGETIGQGEITIDDGEHTLLYDLLCLQ